MDTVRQTAFRAAEAGGRLLIERLGNIAQIDYKSAFNIVTDVDKASEKTIVETLKADFPDYDILAEEGSKQATGCKRRWLIDPLDGTTNYTHSYPFFAVSIGLEEDGKMILGVVYNPFSKEMFWAEAGGGAWLNDRQIRVSKIESLSTSLLATGFPPGEHGVQANNIAEFAELTQSTHGVRRDGSAALDLSFVACGRLDGFWETKLAPWDLAAGTLIVAEAGGTVTNLSGGKFDINSGYVLATNGLIHKQAIECVSKVKEKLQTAGTQA